MEQNWISGFATILVLILILVCQSIRVIVAASSKRRRRSITANSGIASSATTATTATTTAIISDLDLQNLINNLDESFNEEKWEDVVNKKNNLLSYNVKSCKPKEGPLKYLSVTIFENCDTELLRDFYMDNEYRRQWDKTVVEHQRLEADKINGVEIGRTIKKFPLLTPREYILAWKIWEGNDKTFYCLNKECEHALAPLQKKYVRVRFFRSGWRISKGKLVEADVFVLNLVNAVPGRDACEIKLLHQEDAGLNVEMAKLAFSKGIWSYVCKMDSALHKYSPTTLSPSGLAVTSATLMKKVPPELERVTETTPSALEGSSSTSVISKQAVEVKGNNFCRKPSKKLVANGLLLLGGLLCLSRGHSSLSAKLAMACILKKLSKHGTATGQAAPS
ncbi:hypothetical protein GIB67_009827 [Kingdonia uniflora]|uniref:START domain-containing protein n=1 Tax=Kingdonia uniflora TaxID=39325 RepID=A0A7J7LMG1_9MAGN|nr:hypothetical protein GIB67_009827 [Kingdonia uniflora]